MGKKYIVKLDDNKLAYTAIIIDGVPYIKPLQLLPYIEPDMEQVRKEAYQKGLSDAWEAARKIAKLDTDEQKKLFGCFGIYFVAHEFSASEAIEKIRQYEQEKEELKKEQSFTAEEVMRQYLDTFCKGKSCTGCPLHTPDFTCGRGYHFLTNKQVSDEEVRKAYAAVLAKMKE